VSANSCGTGESRKPEGARLECYDSGVVYRLEVASLQVVNLGL
jgi:hypothetical protein